MACSRARQPCTEVKQIRPQTLRIPTACPLTAKGYQGRGLAGSLIVPGLGSHTCPNRDVHRPGSNLQPLHFIDEKTKVHRDENATYLAS